MTKRFILPLLLMLVSMSVMIQAQDPLAIVSLKDINQPGTAVPVELSLKAGLVPQDATVILYETGLFDAAEIPCQVKHARETQLSFIYTSSGRGYRTFHLQVSKVKKEPVITSTLNDSTILIKRDKQDILHYRHQLLPAPKGQDEKWARNAFIHPLYAPGGEVLTWVQPADHLHHMGLWNPWTRCTWKGGNTDFWNLATEMGTVRFKNLTGLESGTVFAEFSAFQEHVAFVEDAVADTLIGVPLYKGHGFTPEGKTSFVVMGEEWIVRVWNTQDGYLLDFTSVLTNLTDEPVSLDAYRYGGGLGYRATEKWNNTNSKVLTSEGKTWKNGDATRANWCRVSGDLNGIETGLLFMSDPGNFDAPQPMRIWPDNSNDVGHQYFEFTPIRENTWILDPGKTYKQAYRIWVQEGELPKSDLNAAWKAYSLEPEVSIKYPQVESHLGQRVLIYTKNGEGFIHDNIEASVKMLQDICDQNQIEYEISDDPKVFEETNLSRFAAIIFSNTNNDAFGINEQRLAFKRYIQAGGGFIGIHSACGSERNWPWFWEMLGGSFLRHPPYQKFSVKITDGNHPSTSFFTSDWEWEDEAYYLHQLNPNIHVLLSHDLETIEDKQKEEFPGSIFGNQFPGAWCQEFDGGKQFYTSYGHQIKHYSDPLFKAHIRGGILWTLDKGDVDFTKARATTIKMK